MKKILFSLFFLTCATVLMAVAFTGSKIDKTLPKLGQELISLVGVAGKLQIELDKLKIEEMVRNSEKVLTNLNHLVELAGSIDQLIAQIKPNLSFMDLEEERRVELLQFVPADRVENVKKAGKLDFDVTQAVYKNIKASIQRDSLAFKNSLMAAREKISQESINDLGRRRGALIASVGGLLKFSGHIQELGFVN